VLRVVLVEAEFVPEPAVPDEDRRAAPVPVPVDAVFVPFPAVPDPVRGVADPAVAAWLV
jgi:hypothetical protein